MGLFSKKTVICKKCGKEFQIGFLSSREHCSECSEILYQEYLFEKEKERKVLEEKRRFRDEMSGYSSYGQLYLNKEYSEEELKAIELHRDNILEKYRVTDGLSLLDLSGTKFIYNSLSDEQCLDVLLGITNIMLPLTLGAAYTSRFFVPTYGKGMVVDAEDIFAVCYTSDYRLTANSSEVILCAVFTNDPYIPVFPMVFLGKTGMFELLKSKKGRENVKATFESNCPKLTYPVMELKEMKKIVKKEESVRGNIDKKFMLKNMEDAHYSSGLFDTRGLSERLGEYTEALMEEYGYYPVNVINEEIGMEDKKIAKFWKDKMAKFTQEK